MFCRLYATGGLGETRRCRVIKRALEWLAVCSFATLGMLGSCAKPPLQPVQARIEARPAPVKDLTAADADTRADRVRRDPVAYLREVLAKCGELKQYTLNFTRYERRGLLSRLQGPEHIQCWFRQKPFSVRMKWLDDSMKYFESAYAAGQFGNQVRFVTRWAIPFLLPPPAVNKVDLQTPVTWGESKRPLTDFGLERLMQQTVTSMDKSGDAVVVTYEGLFQLPETGATVHHLRLVYSDAQHPVPVQDLYIDTKTDLPSGTILKYTDGRIDSAYFYKDLNTNVQLTDRDLLLEGERKSVAKAE
jgi:hypothetical protein